MKQILDVFNTKWLKITLFVVLLQQILVACGTYFLGELSSQFPTDGFQVNLAIVLFICILLPGTLIHYWVAWCTTRANKAAQLSYLTKYIQSNFNNPTHWRDEKSKQQRHDIMCRGGQETIQSSVHFFVDVAATGLNIILNTVSIILVTDLTLGVVIIISGVLGLWIIHLAEAGISKSSRNEMLADNQLNAHMSRSWDNIILGNQLFFDRWKKQFMDYFLITESSSLQTVKTRDWAVSIGGMVTNALVLGSALFLAWTYRENAGFVLAILVMLPRSLQIVMHIQIIQTYLAQWKNLREKLMVTQESLSKPKPIDLCHLIQQDGIIIKKDNKQYKIEDLEYLLEKNKTGRFTITGPNGIGKSSLLLKLKNKFNLSATYLPAHHHLMLREAQLGLSTGEIALLALNDLQSDNTQILLLDEWDANLSAKNRAILNQVIDQISLKKNVVEIRHSIDLDVPLNAV